MKLIKKNHYKEFRPTCINEGCEILVHTTGVNKNGTYRIRAECYKCHNGFRNRPGVTPHKKTYCENRDGRLGIVCEAKIEDSCMLEMDHINSDKWNNDPDNVQTLCRNCHAYKTKQNGDTRNNKPELYTDINVNKIETTLTKYMN